MLPHKATVLEVSQMMKPQCMLDDYNSTIFNASNTISLYSTGKQINYETVA